MPLFRLAKNPCDQIPCYKNLLLTVSIFCMIIF
uniref:Uncharacterized protein n=1 Tax=Arundo donax TaxID=35708 RepID=A0A0A9AM94_ARUDO